MSDNKKKKSIDEKIADALDIDLNNNNNSEEETKQNEILSLIDRAKSHDLAMQQEMNLQGQVSQSKNPSGK